jgi:NADPH:quinone reductase-like Zn-dependent oxidoreductase
MKALVINQFGSAEQLQIQEVAMPLPANGEVLVRVHAAGINPVDFKIRNGSMKMISGKKFPRILGGDVAGVVEQAGNSEDFRPGDKVFAMLSIKGGAYAEFATIKENQLCHIPDGFTMTEAAATPLAALTALQAFQKSNGLKPGDKVLINGASGGVGSFAVQIAKAMGAVVTGVCSSANADFVKSLGADKVIDYTKENFTKTKEQYNTVFDAVAKSSFGRCKKIIVPGGKYVSTLPNNGLLITQAFNFMRRTKAHFIMAKPSGNDLLIIADFMKQGLIKPVVQQAFLLQDGAKAHRLIETERVRGKLVLTVIE